MDPMKEIFSVFQHIDKDSLLQLVADYTFKPEKSALQEAVALVSKLFSYLRNPQKSEATTSSEKESAPKPDLFFKYYYCLQTQDTYLKESISQMLSSVFAPFVSDGSFKIREKSTWQGTKFTEVVNLFHLPLRDNFTKGMEYTLYRKLPYPTNLPTLSSIASDHLTVLGNTDYRGDSIRF